MPSNDDDTEGAEAAGARKAKEIAISDASSGDDGNAAAETTDGESEAAAGPSFPVVGIGASAGGLGALKTLLKHTPDDAGIAYVVVQHLDPTHDSLMADLLGRYTRMTVVEAVDATLLQPDCVYIIPPGKFLRLADGGLFLDKPVQRRGMRMPIDYFFRSLAEGRREQAIALILTGTGSDGAQGIREVKAQGGLTIVQKPSTAEYDGMPRSALNTGAVDLSLRVEEIPSVVLEYASHPYSADRSSGFDLGDEQPDQFEQVMRLLRGRTQYDFRAYKKGTLSRRIQRRMGLLKCANLEEYVEYLREDANEVQALFKDLLISVTRFLRDKPAWDALAEEVIPEIVARKKSGDTIRVWCPGCATGEEAYSIAILFAEEMEKQRKAIETHIFATDIDEDAILVAREGMYPDTISQDISPKLLQRYFLEEGSKFRVIKRLRQMTVFAVQNLIGDPPFSNLDLISCRNLMIYLEPEVQVRVIELMHFALNGNGVLFLGSSETLGRHARLFTPVSASLRIFQRLDRRPSSTGHPQFPVFTHTPPGNKPVKGDASIAKNEIVDSWASAVRLKLLETFVPASVLIDRRQEVQYFQGVVREYLSLAEGEPSTQLLPMAAEGSRPKLRGLLNRVIHGGEAASATFTRFSGRSDERHVVVTVAPIEIPPAKELYYIVSFGLVPEEAQINGDKASRLRRAETDEEESPAVAQLQYELSATREDLQSTIEELESSNEELKASNEEVMSMNEELQSTNEELETSREELQSLNEELSTVNNQLEDKVEELETTNDDLTNLLSSTDVATIFLDTSFCIRRFTPATKKLLNILESDIGRPISDLAPKVNDENLVADAQEVLNSLAPREIEVRSGGERWFMRRILPYRTSDNRIAGVVVTFNDVTSLKDTELRLLARERQQASIARLGRIALTLDDLGGLFDEVCAELAQHLGIEFSKLLELNDTRSQLLLRAGRGWRDGAVGNVVLGTGLDSQAGFTLQSAAPIVVDNLETEKRFSGPELLREHGVVSGLSVIIGPIERPWGVLGAHTKASRKFLVDDVNYIQSAANICWEAIKHERAEGEYRDISNRLQRALEVGRMGAWEWDIASNTTIWSRGHFTLLGYEPGSVEPGWKAWESRIHPDDKEPLFRIVEASKSSKSGEYHAEYRICPEAGRERWVEARGQFHFDDSGEAIWLSGILIDIDERKAAEKHQAILLHELDHRVKNILANISALASQTSASAVTIQDFVADFRGRIGAMARAHSMLSASRWTGVELEALVHEELGAFVKRDGANVDISGPPMSLKPDDAQLLSIAIHELATNASKYGALKTPDGSVTVSWSVEGEDADATLVIDWREAGGETVSPPEKTGFGTAVLRRLVPAQLQATIDLDFAPEGVHCRITLPMQRIEAPRERRGAARASEFASDYSGDRSALRGRRILVVEDSALTAEDLRITLEREGAQVVGPALSLDVALRLCASEKPDAAVIDRNLNGVLSDDVAFALLEQGAPVLIVTGYGDGNLPEALMGLPVVSKPIDMLLVCIQLARLLGREAAR